MSEMDRDGDLPSTEVSVYRPSTQLAFHRMPMPDHEADTIRRRCISGSEREFGKLMLPNPPSSEERTRLQERHRALVANLTDHNLKEIGAAVADLIACYRNFVKQDENPKTVLAKYVKELHGVPTWACVRACNAIRNNQAPGFSIKYPFSTIELRQYAESYIISLQDEAREIFEVLNAGQLPAPQSPETRAKVQRQLERLAFHLKSKADREREEYLAPILQRQRENTDQFILREYQRRGETPVFFADRLVSPQLLTMVRESNNARHGRADQTAPQAQGNPATDEREG